MFLLANYLLILLGAVVEFVLDGAARWRSARWSLDWLRWLEKVFGTQSWWRGWLAVLVTLGVPVAAVAAGFALLHELSALLAYAISLIVFVLMLGPEDLAAEVAAHQREPAAGARDRQNMPPPAYLRHAGPVDLGPLTGDDEFDEARGELAALALAAEHAWFQPLFWFLVLGPVGAVAYRLCANLRRAPGLSAEMAQRFAIVREALEFVPARITVGALGVAGTLVPVLDCARHAGLGTWGASATLVARTALAATDNGRIREVIGGDAQRYRINQMHALLKRAMTVWLVMAAAVALAAA
ncbi:MAG: hypothetical protein WD928_11830 [Gammaproteobacteria bacterium]